MITSPLEHAILQDLPLGCCLLDSTMHIVLWNTMIATWTGLAASDVLNKNAFDIFPVLRKPRFANRLQGSLENGSPAIFSSAFTKQLFTTCADYADQRQQCTATRIQLQDGNFALSITVNDVTEQHQRIQQYKKNASLRAEHEDALTDINTKLANSNNYLDEFAYIVSHDLKAPLRNVNSLLSWLIEDLGDDLSDDINDYVDKIQHTVSGMATLISSLLAYAQAGHEQGTIESFPIDALCEEVIQLHDIPSHISVQHTGTACSSSSSRLLLGQVIGNMLSNAIKYHDKDTGSVRIHVCPHPTRTHLYTITLTDDGAGIAEKYHQKIFQIFQKAHHDQRADSTGIGLALVKKIIENQGGTISVASELEKGSCFTFTWPISVAPADS